jgi:hypothetical protein
VLITLCGTALLLQVTLNTTSTTRSSSSSQRYNGSTLPPGSYCTKNERGLSCGIDVTYCCLGSWNLSSGIPSDWKQRLVGTAADPNASAAAASATPTAAALPVDSTNSSSVDSSNSSSANSSQKSPTKDYVVALAVALPVLAVLFAAGIIAMLRWTRREVSRRTSSSTQDPAAAGFGSVTALLGACGPSSARTLSDPSGTGPLLQPSRAAAVRAQAPVGVRDSASSSHMQPLLDSAPSSASCALSPFAQPSWQEQLETQQHMEDKVCKAAAAAAAAAASVVGHGPMPSPFPAGSSGSHGQSLVSLWLLRGRTMPADLLARAVDQFLEAQQQLQHGGAESAAGAAGVFSSNSPEPPDPPLKRWE